MPLTAYERTTVVALRAAPGADAGAKEQVVGAPASSLNETAMSPPPATARWNSDGAAARASASDAATARV